MNELELKEGKEQKSHNSHRTSQNSGITLVALIITIIILLILAVVAIRAVQGDGIIQHAKNAKSATTVAQEKEQIQLAVNEWNIQKNYPTNSYRDFESFMREKFSDITKNADGSLTIKMPDTNNEYKVKEDGTITELADNGGGSNPNLTEGSLVQMYINGILKVGDYVDYNPATASAYSPDGETKGSLTGYTGGDLQSIAQENLNWRVLGYDEANDKLLLISGAPTTNGISFYGHTGYNNYEEVLNNTCSALYSNSTIGEGEGATARSITMNDIDTYLGGSAFNKTTFGGGSSSEGGYEYNNPSSVSSYFSVDSNGKLSEKLTEQVQLDNLTSNAYYYTASAEITEEKDEKYETKLEILQGTNTDKPYYFFAAERSVRAYSNKFEWCIGSVCADVVGVYFPFCDSNGMESSINPTLCLRPVVSLGSNVTTHDVPILETAPLETWNDPMGMY